MSFTFKRLLHYRQILLTLAFGVILATAMLVCGPLLVDTVMNFALPYKLHDPDPLTNNLRITTYARLEQTDYQILDRQIRTSLDQRLGLHLDLVIPAGKLVAIKGKSGSGKTTLLNLIAGIDDPTMGEIAISGKKLSHMSPGEKVRLIRKQIGFIFQTFGLLPFLTVEENVEIPLRLLHTSRKDRIAKVKEILAVVGLSGRAHHRTYELSGGEQQRVAIARALIHQPKIILADEPTGQLDTATGIGIMELMRDIVQKTRMTILVASHDPNVWQFADLTYELRDGQLVKPA